MTGEKDGTTSTYGAHNFKENHVKVWRLFIPPVLFLNSAKGSVFLSAAWVCKKKKETSASIWHWTELSSFRFSIFELKQQNRSPSLQPTFNLAPLDILFGCQTFLISLCHVVCFSMSGPLIHVISMMLSLKRPRDKMTLITCVPFKFHSALMVENQFACNVEEVNEIRSSYAT